MRLGIAERIECALHPAKPTVPVTTEVFVIRNGKIAERRAYVVELKENEFE